MSRGGSIEVPRRPRRQDDGGPKGGEEDIEEREGYNSKIGRTLPVASADYRTRSYRYYDTILLSHASSSTQYYYE